jgi:hypothetical protein
MEAVVLHFAWKAPFSISSFFNLPHSNPQSCIFPPLRQILPSRFFVPGESVPKSFDKKTPVSVAKDGRKQKNECSFLSFRQPGCPREWARSFASPDYSGFAFID